MDKDEIVAVMKQAEHFLTRYVKETPLGHQPHMIALDAENFLPVLSAAIGRMEAAPAVPDGWKPIETAPKDTFLLLCGPSRYTTTPLVFTTGRLCSDYHKGRWVDHANDDLTDWGFEPTHWMPQPAAPQPAEKE